MPTAPATVPAPATPPAPAAGAAAPAAPAVVVPPPTTPAAPAAPTAPTSEVPKTPAPEGGKDPASAASPPAPAGELALKLPEGMESGPLLEGFKALAKDVGLDGPKAQKVVDLFVAETQRADAAFTQLQAKWKAELAADPELGGANLPATQALSKKALARFGGEALATVLSDSGLGDHPVVVRAFAAIGKSLKEDSVATPGGPVTTPVVPDEEARHRIMFPTMFKE